jgi:hypothetical protein
MWHSSGATVALSGAVNFVGRAEELRLDLPRLFQSHFNGGRLDKAASASSPLQTV